ncbi:flagellar hook-length control protein FliK [Billgrantia endophytica]|uniref:Flagellar hook-length control protein FliK n=1 Tax=Billgrantia endophytica TaxID=2033802 RepID=A0A2N7UB65_9GAMM|nr:flagellar hook-length control protein FliK [Halomonas endophytica]PMR77688.1 flagellar hook-length control protein FliK [Halomonas endophytica]
MSGITPLLDTLLHQVLGKRVDTQPPRDLNEPVRPVNAGEGPRALHSDSRLEGRRPGTTPLPVPGSTGPLPRGDAPGGQADSARPPASFQTHFSPSARTIADLLVRFPAPPSVLSATGPLMGADESPSAATLANRLQVGIRDSGLFYESHLSRWYRGELTRQQLEREPQMWRTLRFSPAAVTQGGAATSPGAMVGPAAGGAGLPGAQVAAGAGLTPPPVTGGGPIQGPAAQAQSYAVTGALLPATSSGGGDSAAPRDTAAASSRAAAMPGQGAGPETAGREPLENAARMRPGAGEPVHESLQGVVRHQLEMLVTPVLRWEGDVWSGIFMALMVQLPVGARHEDEGEQEGDSSPGYWHSELRLTVPSLGEIRVAMWLRDVDVRLELKAADEPTLAILQGGVPTLEQRLQAAGMSRVLIDARLLEEGKSHG